MKGAIVTGSARGLGKEIAVMLAKEGYATAINYRKSGKEAKKTLQVLIEINRNCLSVKGDLTKQQNVKKLFESAKKKFGRIDVLVNNVGDFLYKPLLQTTKKELMGVIENNVATALLCSKEAIKAMRKQGYGRIINIGSTGCDELLAPEMTTPYYMAKTSIWLLTKALARAAGEGITVNMVSPGILKTSVVKKEGVEYTSFDEVTNAILMLIKSSHNGKNMAIARWKPEG